MVLQLVGGHRLGFGDHVSRARRPRLVGPGGSGFGVGLIVAFAVLVVSVILLVAVSVTGGGPVDTKTCDGCAASSEVVGGWGCADDGALWLFGGW